MSRDYTEITDEQLRAINKRAVEQPSYEQLREQNRVLRCALESIAKNTCCAPCREAALVAQAALTATSQPAKEPVRHLCGARGFGQSLDDRCPGCDATSQEGQHG